MTGGLSGLTAGKGSGSGDRDAPPVNRIVTILLVLLLLAALAYGLAHNEHGSPPSWENRERGRV